MPNYTITHDEPVVATIDAVDEKTALAQHFQGQSKLVTRGVKNVKISLTSTAAASVTVAKSIATAQTNTPVKAPIPTSD